MHVSQSFIGRHEYHKTFWSYRIGYDGHYDKWYLAWDNFLHGSFNNEIVAYGVSDRKGDRRTYINGRDKIIEIKKEEYPDYELILHSDQGSVYASKDFNETLPLYNITRSMSRAGAPTDNGAMEAINGWTKEELFTDFKITESDNVLKSIGEYVIFFNNERPAYALGYKTPKQVKDEYFQSEKS